MLRRVQIAVLVGLSIVAIGCPKKADPASEVGANCTDYCACMKSACPGEVFAPSCEAACGAGLEGTTVKKWDIACRAAACGRSKQNDKECPVASGVKGCT